MIVYILYIINDYIPTSFKENMSINGNNNIILPNYYNVL